MTKIFLGAGGTGGHFFSAVAVGEELAQRGYEIHLITDKRCQKYIKSDLPLHTHIVDLIQFPSKFIDKIRFIINLLKAIFESLKLVYNLKPKVIVGFGGYPVLPLMIVAFFFRVPTVIHEQNCLMGKVNRFCAKFAKKISLAYEETSDFKSFQKDKIIITGSIVRANIRNLPVKKDFNSEIFRLFIFGGSQGAKIFSKLLPETIKIVTHQNPELKLHITQQASKEDQVTIAKFYSKLKIAYELSEFFEDMAMQYKNTELVISRAGASTISELEYIGLPAIFIPLPTASQNHQLYNAKILENNRAGWCFEQNKLSPLKLAQAILTIIQNREVLKQASYNLLKRRKDGYKILADTVTKVIT